MSIMKLTSGLYIARNPAQSHERNMHTVNMTTQHYLLLTYFNVVSYRPLFPITLCTIENFY